MQQTLVIDNKSGFFVPAVEEGELEDSCTDVQQTNTVKDNETPENCEKKDNNKYQPNHNKHHNK